MRRMWTAAAAIAVGLTACGSDGGRDQAASTQPASSGTPSTSATEPTSAPSATEPTSATAGTQPTSTGSDHADTEPTTVETEPETTPPATAAPPAELGYVELTGSDVDADDLDLRDLVDTTPSALLLVTPSRVVVAGATANGPVVTDLAGSLPPDALLPIPSAVALCGTAIVASVSGAAGDEVVALDVVTGTERWRMPAVDPEGGHGVACADGGVVVTYDATNVLGLDLDDGSIAWTAAVEPDDPPSGDSGRAVIGSYDGVVVLDIETGEELWRAGDSSDSAVVVGAQGIVLDTIDGLTLYGADGSRLALFPTLQDDVRERFARSFDSDELRVAGAADAPVLVVIDAPEVVDPDGSFRRLRDDFFVPFGTSGELIWAVQDGEDTQTVARITVDGALVDAIEVPEDFEVIAATDEVVLGSVDGVPAFVVAAPKD